MTLLDSHQSPVVNGSESATSTKNELALDSDAYPQHSVLPGIDEIELKSTDSSESVGGSYTPHNHEMRASPLSQPSKPTWSDLAAAVNTWKINDDGSRAEGEVEKSRTPYSVLKLLARHGGGVDGQCRPKRGAISQSPRQNLFDREIEAEGQARVEMTEYIDSLVDRAEYEEAYACVWPLEEYRRQGWATEMVKAYPSESEAFIVGVVNEQSSGAQAEEDEAAAGRQ
ncbi:hypothetical protein PV08_00064 [Exophiala spinifera]|uniref:Uncharacterized protein n=1 Tax=Exophiala spinifera TaxID=91928 RepID=A0A0D2A3P9_9EURO|nr:uncharacterized protein PV08_00064 [Exophiala spinifera]KIW19492.1 hypothetical protein PV08_00064 [Exophiala spinifera]